MRLRVLYDDGAFYPGTIVGCNEQDKRYKIKLDEGTKFSTTLPDPDIEVLGMAPPSIKFWNLRWVGGEALAATSSHPPPQKSRRR